MCKKHIAYILLMTMTFSAVSCGGDTSVNSNTESTFEYTDSLSDDDILYPEYIIDLGGETFTMLYFDPVSAYGWSGIPCDIDEAEITGDILSDAIYNRNRKIENMYNTEFEAVAAGEEIFDTINKSVMAQCGDYDAFFPIWWGITGTITSGVLLRLDNYIDYSLPWWNENSLEAFSISGKTYAVTGSLTLVDKFSDAIIMFNKQMVDNYHLGDIYQMVIDHEWTFEKMLQMCQTVSADVDSNGIYDTNGRYGFSAQKDLLYVLYQSAGEQICRLDEDGIPYLSCDSERALDVLMKITDFMNNNTLYFDKDKFGLSVSETIKMFKSDKVLFMMRPMSTIFDLRDMNADFGIIPTPLMDENQSEYHTSIFYTAATATCIPSDVRDPEISAAILDTLSAESYYSVDPVFYDTVLGDKVTRDKNSTENLKIILDSHIYDPGVVYNFGGIEKAFLTIWKNGSGAISSTIASYKSAVESSIENYIDVIS